MGQTCCYMHQMVIVHALEVQLIIVFGKLSQIRSTTTLLWCKRSRDAPLGSSSSAQASSASA